MIASRCGFYDCDKKRTLPMCTNFIIINHGTLLLLATVATATATERVSAYHERGGGAPLPASV